VYAYKCIKSAAASWRPTQVAGTLRSVSLNLVSIKAQ
jgi:hypothetical protein